MILYIAAFWKEKKNTWNIESSIFLQNDPRSNNWSPSIPGIISKPDPYSKRENVTRGGTTSWGDEYNCDTFRSKCFQLRTYTANCLLYVSRTKVKLLLRIWELGNQSYRGIRLQSEDFSGVALLIVDVSYILNSAIYAYNINSVVIEYNTFFFIICMHVPSGLVEFRKAHTQHADENTMVVYQVYFIHTGTHEKKIRMYFEQWFGKHFFFMICMQTAVPPAAFR